MSSDTETLVIEGLAILVTRKRVRNINLRVLADGQVVVSAPACVARSDIERFVASRRDWIERSLQRIQTQQSHHNPCCTDGQTVWLWGEPLLCHVVSANKSMRKACDLTVSDGSLVVRASSRAIGDDADARAMRTRALDAWLHEELANEVDLMLPDCQRIVGRTCNGLRLRKMTSRWGSCNVSTGVITLSTLLVHHERECLHYVMIHELCHLIEPSHNDRFHLLMDDFCPNWRRIRSQLNGM